DDFFRSFLSSVALGLSTSFVWPGSGGGSLASAGVSQFGNLRLARAGNSAVTGGFGDGFLFLNTNHLSLHHIGSTWTGLLGHSSMVGYGGGGRRLSQTGALSMLSGTFGSSRRTVVSFTTAYAAPARFLQ